MQENDYQVCLVCLSENYAFIHIELCTHCQVPSTLNPTFQRRLVHRGLWGISSQISGTFSLKSSLFKLGNSEPTGPSRAPQFIRTVLLLHFQQSYTNLHHYSFITVCSSRYHIITLICTSTIVLKYFCYSQLVQNIRFIRLHNIVI